MRLPKDRERVRDEKDATILNAFSELMNLPETSLQVDGPSVHFTLE